MEQHRAATIDRSVPNGSEWHRDLLRQMQVALAQVRLHMLSAEAIRVLDECLRFQHVVRNAYVFEFEPARIEHLVQRLQPCFERMQTALLTFADSLAQLAQDD